MEQLVNIAPVSTYSSYKYSGEDWMGDVPEHWEVIKLKHVLFEKKKRTNPALSAGSISFGKVVVKDDEKIPLATKASYQEVRKGEFLINPLNLNYDLISLRIALSNIDVVVSSGYMVLDTKEDVNKEYLNYLLHRYDVGYMKLLGSGVRQTINFNDIANSLLILPPKEEQTRIAQFLDQKTAQIDQAIAQKEKLIELLKERRQILIHDVVTRGLNPNVKKRDSGVEWIGEVPAHWKVIANRILFSERNQPGNDSLPILSVSIHTAVSSEELDEDENIRGKIRIEDKSKYKFVDVGDIVFNMMRAWQGAIGSVSVQGMVSPAYIVAKPKVRFNSEYFEYLYRTDKFIQQMDRVSKGITDFRKRLYWNEFKQLVTLLPPIGEQEEIVSFISRLDEMTDRAIDLKEKEIEKLKEYKAALINSAVTGKMRV